MMRRLKVVQGILLIHSWRQYHRDLPSSSKKEGLNVCDLPILGTATGYVVAILLYLPITLKRPALLNKETFKSFWGPSVGLCAGHLLVFYALKFGEVSRVTPLLQLEPLFIIFLVRYYLKGVEETPFRLIIGALMIILGATLVVLDWSLVEVRARARIQQTTSQLTY